jgi:hypothetical protein
VGLRGAGFPAEQVLQLATPKCAAIADQLLQVEDQLERKQDTAHQTLHRALDELAADSEERKAVKRALRRVNKSKLPEPLDFVCVASAAVDEFRQARIEADAARGAFEEAFTAAIDHTSRAIYQVACTDRFREAVTWQNRRALLTGINSILRKPPGKISRGSKRRQHEELVANYLQRYCVKNDTIGFFGPVGWANLVEQGAALVARPGPDLLASRQVYFEGWCIDELAQVLGRNQKLRPWLVPRVMPYIRLEGTTVYLPFEDPVELFAEQAVVLRLCDGQRMAKEIARQLVGTAEFQSQSQVYDLIEQLQRLQLVVWTVEVSFGICPEQRLRRLLERIEDEPLRQSNLATLDVLEKARRGVALAVGDTKKLNKALDVMDTVFTRLTKTSATRAAGKTYAARTLVYEDCRRDITVDIGPEILQTLGPPLSLLLDSARWFAVQAAKMCHQALQQFYAELAVQTGSMAVPLDNIWPQLQSFLYVKDTPHPFDSVLSVFQERWEHVLSLPFNARRVQYSSEELYPCVKDLFESSQPGWSFTRCHTPDVLIAASSQQAIQRGDYQLVMGELHMGKNTLGAALFLAQHPSLDKVFQALTAERPEPQVVPIVPKQWPELTVRTLPALVQPHDYRLASTHDSIGDPESRVLPIGDLVVEKLGNELVVRTRDGKLFFDAIEFIAEIIADQVVDFFKIMRPAPHTPRVAIDRLVITRETWRFVAQEITFAYEKSEADRFVACQRWVRDYNMPRFVFAKTPVERKPFYIDFYSPIFVNILAKYIRRTQDQGSADDRITVTEMLPDPFQLWLPDAEGQRYTSEFRIVAIDLESIVR